MKDQLVKLKDNWLIVLLVVIVLFFVIAGGNITSNFGGISSSLSEASSKAGYSGGYYTPSYDQGFAPEVTERKIVRTASMGIESERGQYLDVEARLKAIVSSSDSYMLSENVNLYGTGKDQYHQGSYQIKVETPKYASVITQLKSIGKVTSFSENSQDITGQYTNNEIELKAEKDRLKMYRELYAKAVNVADQIQLADKIFDQERRIQYLQESMTNKDLQVDYSTVTVTLSEKRSDYYDLNWVKFSDLIRTLVASAKSLLYLLFAALPYAIAVLVIWIVVRLFRRRH